VLWFGVFWVVIQTSELYFMKEAHLRCVVVQCVLGGCRWEISLLQQRTEHLECVVVWNVLGHYSWKFACAAAFKFYIVQSFLLGVDGSWIWSCTKLWSCQVKSLLANGQTHLAVGWRALFTGRVSLNHVFAMYRFKENRLQLHANCVIDKLTNTCDKCIHNLLIALILWSFQYLSF
jgi:hypothetical protein